MSYAKESTDHYDLDMGDRYELFDDDQVALYDGSIPQGEVDLNYDLLSVESGTCRMINSNKKINYTVFHFKDFDLWLETR
jgi:hypothetical protein